MAGRLQFVLGNCVHAVRGEEMFCEVMGKWCVVIQAKQEVLIRRRSGLVNWTFCGHLEMCWKLSNYCEVVGGS